MGNEQGAFTPVWARIAAHAGETFRTVSGFEFTYRVPGNYVRITRDGREINRSLSRASFSKAFAQLPAAGPGALENVQGPSYTWAILTDRRIQGSV